MNDASDSKVSLVVCAYGHWSKDRTPLETTGYGMYLRKVWETAKDLADAEHEVEVIACGGAMQDGRSEAGTAINHLKRLGPIAKTSYFVEERSLSTPANLVQARKFGLKEHRVLVCCDKAREIKVRWLVKKLYGDLNVEVVAFERPDTSRRSHWLFQLIETICLASWPKALTKRINMVRT